MKEGSLLSVEINLVNAKVLSTAQERRAVGFVGVVLSANSLHL